MAYFDPRSAEAVQQAVRQYMAEASEALRKMNNAGKDCVDNMTGDDVAAKAYASLNARLGIIQMNIDLMSKVLDGMQKEIAHYDDIENYGNTFND